MSKETKMNKFNPFTSDAGFGVVGLCMGGFSSLFFIICCDKQNILDQNKELKLVS